MARDQYIQPANVPVLSQNNNYKTTVGSINLDPSNTTNSKGNIVNGTNNNVTGPNNIVSGNGHNIQGTANFIFGTNHNISSDSNILLGGANHTAFGGSNIIIGGGEGVSVNGNTLALTTSQEIDILLGGYTNQYVFTKEYITPLYSIDGFNLNPSTALQIINYPNTNYKRKDIGILTGTSSTLYPAATTQVSNKEIEVDFTCGLRTGTFGPLSGSGAKGLKMGPFTLFSFDCNTLLASTSSLYTQTTINYDIFITAQINLISDDNTLTSQYNLEQRDVIFTNLSSGVVTIHNYVKNSLDSVSLAGGTGWTLDPVLSGTSTINYDINFLWVIGVGGSPLPSTSAAYGLSNFKVVIKKQENVMVDPS